MSKKGAAMGLFDCPKCGKKNRIRPEQEGTVLCKQCKAYLGMIAIEEGCTREER